jgi:transcriptional antiterminator NusG
VPVEDKLITWLQGLDSEKPLLDPAKMPTFEVGEAVRIEDGPFQGFLGTVLSCDGYSTELLVEIFGRTTKVTIERYKLAGGA